MKYILTILLVLSVIGCTEKIVYKDRIVTKETIVEVPMIVAAECEEPPAFNPVPTMIHSLTIEDKGNYEKIVKALLISNLQSEHDVSVCKGHLDAYRKEKINTDNTKPGQD